MKLSSSEIEFEWNWIRMNLNSNEIETRYESGGEWEKELGCIQNENPHIGQWWEKFNSQIKISGLGSRIPKPTNLARIKYKLKNKSETETI